MADKKEKKGIFKFLKKKKNKKGSKVEEVKKKDENCYYTFNCTKCGLCI